MSGHNTFNFKKGKENSCVKNSKMCLNNQKHQKSSANPVTTKNSESGKMEPALVRMLMASSIIPVQGNIPLNNEIAVANDNQKLNYEFGYKIVKEERNNDNGDFFISILLHALQCK